MMLSLSERSASQLTRCIEWTKQLFQELKLPTTPEEWRKLSEENKIGPANPSKQDLKDGLYDQDVYPFEAPTKNIHFGDPAAWGSGSEIQHGHFMTTRVPWTMLVVEKLVDFDLLRLSRKPRRGAIESLLDYPDFLTYCEDIGRYQETRPLEQNPMIGAFTGIRDMQLDQPRLSKEIGSSKGFSERSATKAQTTKTTSSEAALRAAFVILPDLLCLPLRIPLRWKLDKPRFVLAQGKARIVAVVDGHLTERNISTEQDNDSSGSYAVVKVKPYLLRLATNFRPTLIQIGIEMMAWIAHCVKSERPKKR